MYSRLIKILLLALVAAVVVTFLALNLMKKDAPVAGQTALAPPSSVNIAPAHKNPHRDMLEDTVVATATTPPAQQPSATQPAATGPAKRPVLQYNNLAGTLRITSADIQPQGRIPRDYTCNGNNTAPAFQWSGAPGGAQAYVILFEKIDAAEGNSLQWGVYNIPSAQKSMAGNTPRDPVLAQGVTQAINDAGSIGYIGPCAPRGQFQYTLSVIALDRELSLPAGLKRDDLIRAINGHIIDMAVLPMIHFYRL